MSDTHNQEGFRALALTPSTVRTLDRLGFVTPTPIQSEAIPFAMRGRDLIGLAQTGTGKTLAFGLPMLERLAPGQVGLVLAPTRELALQIQETLFSLGLKSALLIGGAPMERQIRQLQNRPSVIVATPGRLEDHLNRRSCDLRRVSIVVLDEADRMLDMGFAPAIARILDQTPTDRQTMLFSATMPDDIAQLAARYLRDPEWVEVARAGSSPDLIEQELLVLSQEDKPAMLGDLLDEHSGTVLVFARTRHGARKLARAVRGFGHSAAELHSDRTLAQRRDALHGFKTGEYRVLVATDIAARGIDVKEITVVINYDVPENPEDYVHRIGRTGRAGASGRAITLSTPEQHGDVRDIEKLLASTLPLSPRSPMSRPAPSHPRVFRSTRRRR
ncbi:MAG: DEAD/DEAH box helicase [Fimbriimonadaceae bacterium]|nr:DEAD/DEAH box helicase [Fimbriimonadaceae bacterium]